MRGWMARRASRGRVAVLVAALAVVGIAVATADRGPGFRTEFDSMRIGGNLVLDNETGRTTLENMTVTTGRVDGAGNPVGPSTTVPYRR
ncbi:MAG: hypothetical protein ACT4QG_22670 [Sporichthyaceae bacterium]